MQTHCLVKNIYKIFYKIPLSVILWYIVKTTHFITSLRFYF